MPPGDRSSTRWYRRLLLLFPFEFRREFGAEMAGVFAAERVELHEQGGRAMVKLWARTIAGFVRTASREHVTALRQDVAYVLRTLVAAPAFTITALLALAIGIGGTVAVFSVVHLVLLNPLPVRDPSRLVSIQVTDQQNPGYTPTSTDNFHDLRAQQQRLERVAGFAFAGVRLVIADAEPHELFTAAVTGDYFEALGVPAFMGRPIRPDDDRPGATPVVVLGHSLWSMAFGADRSVLGRTVLLNGHPFTVIGVTPAEFRGTQATFETDLFIALSMYDVVTPGTPWFKGRRWRWLNVMGRLKDGTTIEEARAETVLIGEQLAQAYPDVNRGRGLTMLPFAHTAINPNEHGTIVTAGTLLLAVAGLVLLIACVNLANLLLARSATRAREVALRTALGASRGRIVRQLLTESVLLGVAGGMAGLVVTYWVQQWLWQSRPLNLTRASIQPEMGAEVLLFGVGVSVVTGVLFGLIPALQVSRTDVISTLKESGRQPALPGSRRLRGMLVVGEVALSVVALAAAGLFIRSLHSAQQIDPGFAADRLVRLSYNLRGSGYNEIEGRLLHQRVVDALAASPGIVSAAVTTRAPLSGGGGNTITVIGHEPPPGAMGFFVQSGYISPNYFRTTGIDVARGRDFTRDDRDGTRIVGIVNETMARRFWGEGDAIGKQFASASLPGPIEIVGVARDSKYDTIGEDPQAFFYLPLFQRGGGSAAPVTLLVQTAGPPADAVPQVRAAIKALDPSIPLTSIATGHDMLQMATWAPRMAATLVSAFGLLALVLAAIGIYGVTAYTVAQSRQEIGLRMALGATPSGILAMVVGRGVTLATAGAALGIAIALAAAGTIASLLYGVDARDPLTFAVTPIGLVLIALVACFVPARRAAKLDPATTLRS